MVDSTIATDQSVFALATPELATSITAAMTVRRLQSCMGSPVRWRQDFVIFRIYKIPIQYTLKILSSCANLSQPQFRSEVLGQPGNGLTNNTNCGREAMTKSRDDHDAGRRRFLQGMGIAGAGDTHTLQE